MLTEGAELEAVRDRADSQLLRAIDAERVRELVQAQLPQVGFAPALVSEQISSEQLALVANRAARSACLRLARHFELVSVGPDEVSSALNLQLLLTDIRASSAALSGASALVDLVVPGPFRIPAGLGGLAAEALAKVEGQTVMQLRWSKGANALLDNASLSAVGDAYQLADDFGRDVADQLIKAGDSKPVERPRLASDQLDRNRELCRQRFGQARPAARGASLFLPLSPESIDAGAPTEPTEDRDN